MSPTEDDLLISDALQTSGEFLHRNAKNPNARRALFGATLAHLLRDEKDPNIRQSLDMVKGALRKLREMAAKRGAR